MGKSSSRGVNMEQKGVKIIGDSVESESKPIEIKKEDVSDEKAAEDTEGKENSTE